VFYVSWQGADPRDGSTREPSVLVSELIDAALAQHADGTDAAALVVRHPLQPFAPAAFGSADEPRRFSYHAQWWPAAAQPTARRVPLPAWFDPQASAPAAAAGDEAAALPIDELRRFLQAPAEAFLRHRLGLRLAEIDVVGEDVEPLLAPGRGLERHALQRAVFEAALRGDGDATTHALLRARGLLPSGPLGRRTLESVRAQVEPYAVAFRDWRGDAQADAPRFEVALGTVTVHGRIADAYPQGLARVRFDPPGGPSAIRNGLDWLLASASGQCLPLVEFHEGGETGIGPHLRPALDPAQAREALRMLAGLRAKGLQQPLPFAPYSGWEFYRAGGDMRRGLEAAARKWHGSARSWGEGNGEAVRLAMRGRDPFTDESTRLAFVDLAMAIYGAVVAGQLYGGTDADALRALAAGIELEDSE